MDSNAGLPTMEFDEQFERLVAPDTRPQPSSYSFAADRISSVATRSDKLPLGSYWEHYNPQKPRASVANPPIEISGISRAGSTDTSHNDFLQSLVHQNFETGRLQTGQLARNMDSVASLPSYEEEVKASSNTYYSERRTTSAPKVQQGSSASTERLASDAASIRSYVTARSFFSAMSFRSAVSGRISRQPKELKSLREDDEYAQILRSEKLWPIDPEHEQNWSGRGQHARFEKEERKVVDRILEVEELLGVTSTAIVQSVKCRRILLARKTIPCRRRITREWAIKEVAHLTKLNHSHIVRIVGTYILDKELSILIYPVAEYNLETFLNIIKAKRPDRHVDTMVECCESFFGCLSSAVYHIHEQRIKHMDIKPSNILVRYTGLPMQFKIYVADFGIARAYDDIEAAETDGPTSFTRKYASPEVTEQKARGFPADIFSLGCVFLEISVVLNDCYFGVDQTTKLQHLLKKNPAGNISYQANLATVLSFVSRDVAYSLGNQSMIVMGNVIGTISQMLSMNPTERPTAYTLTRLLRSWRCCNQGTEELAEPLKNDIHPREI